MLAPNKLSVQCLLKSHREKQLCNFLNKCHVFKLSSTLWVHFHFKYLTNVGLLVKCDSASHYLEDSLILSVGSLKLEEQQQVVKDLSLLNCIVGNSCIGISLSLYFALDSFFFIWNKNRPFILAV